MKGRLPALAPKPKPPPRPPGGLPKEQIEYAIALLEEEPGRSLFMLQTLLHLPLQNSRAVTSRLLFQSLRHLPTRLLLWIDESHMISEDALREIRLLAEADLEGPPLFSVILSGLPSLKDKLLGPDLFPLWRRVTVKVSLGGLLREEMEPFLAHCFSPKEAHSFTPEALLALLEHSRGLPAMVIQLARACLDAFPEKNVEAQMLGEIAQNMQS